jgi:very-short-patch-repair endonuclease
MGWTAIRIWEHELKTDSAAVLQKVIGRGLTRRRGK